MGLHLSPEAAAVLLQEQLEKLRHANPNVIQTHPHANEEADEGRESKLAGKIMQWCKENGFPCQCNRQSIKARGFLVPGWPD